MAAKNEVVESKYVSSTLRGVWHCDYNGSSSQSGTLLFCHC